MKFGIESYSLASPISTIISLILIIGLYRIGKIILSFYIFKSLIKNVSVLNYQYVPISLLLISLIFYPIVLFLKTSSNIFYISSLIILIFGFWHLSQKIKLLLNANKFPNKLFKNIHELFLVVFIFIYFLLSLGPITDADSLDYHLSVPIHIINHGIFPKDISWFHASQAGLGEISIIFGLIVGA